MLHYLSTAGTLAIVGGVVGYYVGQTRALGWRRAFSADVERAGPTMYYLSSSISLLTVYSVMSGLTDVYEKLSCFIALVTVFTIIVLAAIASKHVKNGGES